MRYLLVLLVTLFVVPSYAQYYGSQEYGYRLQLSYIYAMPLGQFSSTGNSDHVTGQCLPSSGISASAGISLSNKMIVSLKYADIRYQVSQAALYGLQYRTYSDPHFFTTVTNSLPYIRIRSLSAELAYSIPVRSVELEPFVSLGISYVLLSGATTASIHRKQKDDNYSQDIRQYIGHSSNGFIAPGIGIRAYKKIYGPVYGSLGLQFQYQALHYVIYEESSDLLEKKSIVNRSVDQPAASLQFDAGIQVRFHQHKQ